MATTGESIQVIVRVRPWNEKEKAAGTVPVVHTDNQAKTVSVVRRSEKSQTKQTKFSGFRAVLTGFTSQKEVFDSSVEPLVHEVLQGFSATAFAYGQTGTGKTWTMEGDVKDEENFGVIPRSANLIFDTLGDLDRFESSRVTVSYLEIYNEELFDLLIEPDKKGGEAKLRVVEDTSAESRGVYCMGLSEVTVENASEVVNILQEADEKRRVEETKMNKTSSRSHCLFTICVTAREILDGGRVMERTGRLHLVDLAGSESAKTAGGNQDRGRERKNINQSLLALGRVITALQSVSKDGATELAGRVPYRESKLTRLLQEALGGKSKTCIIATCSPSELAVEETVSTLGYAQRACGIKNRPTQNQLMSGVGGGLSSRGGFGGGSTQDWASMELRLSYMETQVREAQFELAKQHELQKEATARAEIAEEVVAGLEEAVEAERIEVSKQKDRVGLLKNNLGKRHVHVSELRHLVGCRRSTEKELTEQANKLIATLRDSVSTSETLQKYNEEVSKDLEERRVESVKFIDATAGELVFIKDQGESHVLSEKAALQSLEEASTHSSASCKQFSENLTQSISKLEKDMKLKAEDMSTNISLFKISMVDKEEENKKQMYKETEVACELVVDKANEVDSYLSALLSDISSSESSLVSWAETTCAEQKVKQLSLSDRADTNTITVQTAAEAMEREFAKSLDSIAEDTNTMETLLGDLSEHSAAAQQQAISAGEAEKTGAESLLAVRVSLEEIAATLTDMINEQREGQADKAVLEQISSAATMIAASAQRQASTLITTTEEVQAAQEAILQLVEEQKETHHKLVQTVIEQVTKTLADQTSILFTKLDSAADAISNRNSNIISKQTELGEDMTSTFQSLNQSCQETSSAVSAWGESDNTASQSVDDTVAVMCVAKEKAQSDALIIAELHNKAVEESVDLDNRTQAEIAKVTLLKDNATIAAERGKESSRQTSAIMDTELKSIDEWKKADTEHTMATLSSIDGLLREVRADFLDRTNKAMAKTQLLAKDTLVNTLREKLSENTKMLDGDSKSRCESWSQFTSSISDALVGEEAGMSSHMKSNCESMCESLRVATEADEEVKARNREGMRARGEALTAFDFKLKEWSVRNEAKLQSFGLEVLRLNSVVEMPSPLTEIKIDDKLASTKPHDALLSELHNGESRKGESLESVMLKRVEHLLRLHAHAVEQNLPFRDPTELETAETPVDPLACIISPPETAPVSLDEATSLDMDAEEDQDVNPLLVSLEEGGSKI